jgi:hypothetical protein
MEEEVNEATVQYVGGSLGSLKARVSCQTLFVENGKEMLLSDLQTVSLWALKNAMSIADIQTSQKRWFHLGYLFHPLVNNLQSYLIN